MLSSGQSLRAVQAVGWGFPLVTLKNKNGTKRTCKLFSALSTIVYCINLQVYSMHLFQMVDNHMPDFVYLLGYKPSTFTHCH